MATLVKWRPETKAQREAPTDTKYWLRVKEVGEFMLVSLAKTGSFWIKRNQVTEWRFV
jgi:hypothetical protein